MILFLVACGRLQLSELPDIHGAAWEAPEATTVRCEADGDLREASGEGAGSIRGLLAGVEYLCSAEGPGGSLGTAKWTPQASAADLPVPQLELGNADAGYFLVNVFADTPVGPSFALIVDGQGQVRWEQRLDAPVLDMDLSWVGDKILAGGGGLTPRLWNLDGVVTWSPPGGDQTTASRWHHDSGTNEAGDGLLALVREPYTLPNGGTSEEGFAIEEYNFETGELTWRWSVTDDGASIHDLGDRQSPNDPFHANSVFERDGIIYLGIRKADAVVLIDKQSKAVVAVVGAEREYTLLDETGEAAGAEGWFMDQHDIQVHDGLLTVFSNASRETGFQVKSYRLDQEAKTAQIADVWDMDEGKLWYSQRLGGVDPIPEGGYSVAFGDTDGPSPSTLFLVDAAGSISYQVSFPENHGIYRSERRISW